MTPWWDPQTMGMVGGIGGAVIGTIGGLHGGAIGYFAPRGKYKSVVLTVHVSMIVAGAAVLIAGLVAVFSGQPYAVYYPLLLLGGLVTMLFTFLFPVVIAQYRHADARKLDAEEFRRG